MLNMEAIPKFYIKSDIKDISTKLTTWIGHKNTKTPKPQNPGRVGLPVDYFDL